jgi:hypothetical protein
VENIPKQFALPVAMSEIAVRFPDVRLGHFSSLPLLRMIVWRSKRQRPRWNE